MDYKSKIGEEIKRIMELEHNNDAANKFRETLSKIKPKSCIVKSEWISGEYIGFLLAFELGSNNEPFKLFIDNINDTSETFGFLMGLTPKTFEIKYNKIIETDTHCFIDIRLK